MGPVSLREVAEGEATACRDRPVVPPWMGRPGCAAEPRRTFGSRSRAVSSTAVSRGGGGRKTVEVVPKPALLPSALKRGLGGCMRATAAGWICMHAWGGIRFSTRLHRQSARDMFIRGKGRVAIDWRVVGPRGPLIWSGLPPGPVVQGAREATRHACMGIAIIMAHRPHLRHGQKELQLIILILIVIIKVVWPIIIVVPSMEGRPLGLSAPPAGHLHRRISIAMRPTGNSDGSYEAIRCPPAITCARGGNPPRRCLRRTGPNGRKHMWRSVWHVGAGSRTSPTQRSDRAVKDVAPQASGPNKRFI